MEDIEKCLQESDIISDKNKILKLISAECEKL